MHTSKTVGLRGLSGSAGRRYWLRGEGYCDGVDYNNSEYGRKNVQEKFLMLQIKKKVDVQRKDYSEKKKAIDGEDKHR